MGNWFNYKIAIVVLVPIIMALGSSSSSEKDVKVERWGFYGHKRINRVAIFTLPPEMFGFYKEHIEYLTEHAVDPDKRR